MYAFSRYNSLRTVTLLDLDGTILWQFSIPAGSGGGNSNMIKYKEIDGATDMIIATAGSNTIDYNRIISSSISPYSV